jgi:hypothetical protein
MRKGNLVGETNLGTNASMAIFIEGWSRGLLTLSTVDRVENNTPLSDIDSRVLKEVVKEDLESSIAINPVPTRGGLTSLNSKPLLS